MRSTKPSCYLVGGAGYIGSRLNAAIPGCAVIDPKVNDCIEDRCDNLDPSVPVIYLAGFHELPEGLQDDPEWKEAMEVVMVDTPRRLVENGHPLVYFSSMRALTHDTTYAEMKRRAEDALARCATIIRPGTVYGGLHPDLPNRTATVPNKYILTGELPDEHWRAWVVRMDKLVERTQQVLHDLPFLEGAVINAITFPEPLTRDTLRTNINVPEFFTPGIEPEVPHPMDYMAGLYGLDYVTERK